MALDKLNLLRGEIERLQGILKSLESNGEIKNVEKYAEVSRKLNALFCAQMGLISGFSKIQTRKLLDKTNVHLQDTYNDKWLQNQQMIQSFLQALAATAMFAGLKFEVAQKILSPAFDFTARSVEGWSKMTQNQQQAMLSADQYLIDSLKRSLDELSSEGGSNKNKFDEILRQLSQLIEQRSRMFSAIGSH